MSAYMSLFLVKPILCLITDRRRFGEARFLDTIEKAVEGGVNVVQLREKDLTDEALFDLAHALREITRGRALLFVNGRPSVAAAAGADGVHWPDGALPPRGLHRGALLPPDAADTVGRRPKPPVTPLNPGGERVAGGGLHVAGLAGCSVHDEAGAGRAAKFGADYIQAGPVFATASHPGQAPRGPGWLAQIRVAAMAAMPRRDGTAVLRLIAVGGVDASNAGDCTAAGADGIAVISAIGCAGNPRKAARALRDSLARVEDRIEDREKGC